MHSNPPTLPGNRDQAVQKLTCITGLLVLGDLGQPPGFNLTHPVPMFIFMQL
jgi:hypothetical protein